MPVAAPYSSGSSPWAILMQTKGGDHPLTMLNGLVWTSIVKSRGKPFHTRENVYFHPAAKDFHLEVKADPNYPGRWLLRVPNKFRDVVLVNRVPVRDKFHPLTDGDNISIHPRPSHQKSFTILFGSHFFHYYKLGRSLGRGALSTFYTCRHGDSGDLRTVKVTHHSRSSRTHGDELYYAAACRERAMLSVLSKAGGHDNVLSIVDTFIVPTATYIVTELVDENLRHFISVAQEEGRRLAVCEFEGFIGGISSGMAFVHEHDIIHGNLTLENIVLCGGVAKIVGFEAARFQNSHDVDLWERIVPAPYIAPEIRRGGHYDKKADCWALGIVAQTLFAGLPVMDRLLENKLIALDLPEWCTELVRNLLSQNPEGRPSMANVHSIFNSLFHPEWSRG